jgi:nicotinate-nucleotide adenylyltransferase
LKLAIFGGTYDPIHCAHLTVAREAAAHFDLDRILFIPAANPPHKPESMTAYEHRLRMVELAVAKETRFQASRLEEGTEKSYSIVTIERVKASLRQDDEVFFLIGADAFAEIDTWHRAGDVIREVTFIVVTRPGHDYDSPPGSSVLRLDTLALPVSSSEIRESLMAGGSPRELDPEVLTYIRANGLYGTARSTPAG